MTLSIIIPVYNEEKTVSKLIQQVLISRLPNGIKKEIIIVNDGSTDDTTTNLKNISQYINDNLSRNAQIKIFTHRINKGKGAAIKTALKYTKGDIIIIQDADLEYNPKDYPRLLKPILKNQVSVVYGSRFKNQPLLVKNRNTSVLLVNRIANKFLTWFTNFLFQANLTDMETCYKVFTKKVIKKIKLRSNRFTIEPELTAKFLKNGCRITEVSITSKPRSLAQGKKITWQDGVFAIWALVKYKFAD